MAATLVGEAAIRIVPTLRGFKTEADRRLNAMKFDHIKIEFDPQLGKAEAEVQAWRQRQELNAVSIPVRADLQTFRRDLSQVEHIFKRNSLSKALRLNIKVIGLDALPALAYAAGSATSGLDALAKSAFALPGLLGGALASVGALAVGLNGVGAAFKAYSADSKDATTRAREIATANRNVESSYRSYRMAVRDTIREIQDLNAENRRSSLNVADAVLSVQEAADRIREGGQRSLTELKRDQLSYLQALDHLQEVQTKAQRTAQDAADANAQGVEGADRVLDALDQIAKNTEALSASKISEVDKALGQLSPNMRKTVEAVHGLSGAWHELQQSSQDALSEGLDVAITELGQKALPGLSIGIRRTASGINAALRSALSSVGGNANQGLMSAIFGNTDIFWRNMARGMDPLISGFTRLTKESSDFLPRIGNAFSSVFDRFDRFTKRVSTDGSLDRWIDSGLKAIGDLGNSLLNIGGIVSSVAAAFDKASGHKGGFISSLADGTKKLDDFLKSTRGQNMLAKYFGEARDFIDRLWDALKRVKGGIGDAVEAAREWSAAMLGALGVFISSARWIEQHTHALSTLLKVYLTYRTVKPILEGLTGAWKNYNKVVEAAARFEGTRNIPGVQATARNLRVAKGEELPGLSSRQAREEALRFGEAVDRAGNRYDAFGRKVKEVEPKLTATTTAAGNARKGINDVGDAATRAGEKIGGAGRASMLTRVGALAGALFGPLALTAAVGGAIIAIDKLGESHRKAAEDADRQRVALDGLKGAIDDVTGNLNAQGVTETAKSAQKYAIPGLGDRNLFEDARRSNLVQSDAQLLAAMLPGNDAQRSQLLGAGQEQLKSIIGSSAVWRGDADLWNERGIDLDTFVAGLRGDQKAKEKVDKAYNDILQSHNIFPWMPAAVNTPRISAGQATGAIPHDFTSVLKSTGTIDLAAPLIGLSDIPSSLGQHGADKRQVNEASNGQGRFKPGGRGAAIFGPFGGLNDSSHIAIGQDGNGVITTDRDPNVDETIGSTTKVRDGQYETHLTADATAQLLDVQKFKDGGLVRGIGGPRDDMNLVRVSPYEHITNADAVSYYGVKLFDDLNNKRIPRHFGGGFPFDIPQQPPMPVPSPIGPIGGGGGIAPMPAVAPGFMPEPAAPAPAPAPVPAPLPAPPPRPAPAPDLPPIGPKQTLNPGGAAPSIGKPAPHLGDTPVTPGPGADFSIPGADIALGGGVPDIREPYGIAVGSNSEGFGGQGVKFPDWVNQLGSAFGLKASTYPGHQEKSGLNKGIDWTGPPENLRAFAEYVKSVPGMEQVIFMDPRDGTKIGVDPGDRGANQSIEDYYRDDWGGHTDHVHTRQSWSIPLPGGRSMLPNIYQQGGGSGTPNLLAALKTLPDNIQPVSIAKQVGQVGLQALAGIFGLDLSYVQAAQQIGNYYLSDEPKKNSNPLDKFMGALNGSNGSNSGADVADQAMSDYSSGVAGLSPQLQQKLAANGMSFDPSAYSSGKGGAPTSGLGQSTTKEQIHARYGALIAQICAAMGVDPSLWQKPLEEQIWTESKGDPFSINPNDTDGKGGRQTVQGLFNFLPTTFDSYKVENIGSGSINDPVSQIAAAINYTIKRWGVNKDGSPNQIGRGVGFADGGWANDLAWLSTGEYRTSGDATKFYGPALFDALNSKKVPRNVAKGFADGGFPLFIPPPPAPGAGGQTPGPLDLDQPEQQPAPTVQVPSIGAAGAVPSTGGAPGPGATAPAPDPGALPQVNDALTEVGGAGAAMGAGPQAGDPGAQPGASPTDQPDMRATLGAAPTSQEHNNPSVSGAIKGAAGAIGGLAAMAASMGINTAAPGAGGAAGQGIQAGFQMGGQAISGAVNILSSLLVGTATGGSTQSASGIPMLPSRQPQQTGVPKLVNDNRQYHVTNLDEFKRVQATSDAQAAMPYISKYG
ncbi:Phage-related minor tail protein-like [Mycobacteroides abscessus subsp. massiliense]|uniref:hypothetical protein n=2 Tax=Mycobacteroides abscessus TaxID=36809 RepID=UPI0009C86103|nr:hypothetical protein [Mycobacteroides abscessus]SLH92215.1 Phage-related minor tail protein-like [Mycobacteroides abscessus subsp. massiliense]SLI30845.1 Phage-related minor tail protein-like [Mycobacteroides abscessus subsp. massiliense]